ncbi:MAG: MSMEG_0570 family nitrogen starvation response protein [Pseudomonadota bacterium]
MPAIHYRLRWPDQTETCCYSPSTTIREFFQPGQAYPLSEFLDRIRAATQHSSDRVAARYGFACSAAADQLATIEARARLFAAQADASVALVAFE